MHKLISILLQLTSQINKNFPRNHTVPGLLFLVCSADKVDRYTLLLRKTQILNLLKNSDVKEVADRSGELYIDQGDIGYAGAKIAVKRSAVLSEKANCFYDFLAHVVQNYFCIFDFFYKCMHLQA